MNKFLITLATLVAFALSSVAHADVKISGFLQQIVGAGDEVDGGVTYKFNRFSFGADTTTDNGWTVGGSFAAEFGNMAAGRLVFAHVQFSLRTFRTGVSVAKCARKQ